MLHSTKGIVLHSIKYSESSIIVKIYTDLFGIQSYLVKGIRNVRSKIKPGLFQCLTLLDMVAYHREKQSLQILKEVHLAFPYQNLPFDIRKSAVAIFINELVYKSIREEEPNPDLFTFLWQTCLLLDETHDSVSWFHIRFALQLMHFLGIFPQNNHSELLPIFNMREGIFQATIPNHPHYLDQQNSHVISMLLASCEMPQMNNNEMVKWRDSEMSDLRNGENFAHPGSRNKLLETVLVYYQLHLPGFRAIQSHHILHDVLA
jgi:DNA repair protein RecO (recombination protein O)